MPKRRAGAWAVAATMVLMVAAACGGDDGAGVRNLGGSGSSGSGSGSGSSSALASGSASGSAVAECMEIGDPATADIAVAVQLDEWSVTLGDDRLNAGEIGFFAANRGEEPHEVVLVEAGGIDELPVADGQVQEDELPEGAFIGEIEAFAAGTSCAGAFELDAGEYVAFCNILEEEADGTVESHFEEGMATEFVVE